MFDVSPVLLLTALSLGIGHAILAPDHSIPFIAMAWEGRWSLRKALVVTFLCGLAHILSSVFIGLIGIGLKWEVSRAVSIEAFRGDWIGWMLMAFGFLYLIWGLKKAYAVHRDESEKPSSGKTWLFFLVFAFGPCEPLIPLLMYPASHQSPASLLVVTLTFGAATLLTMLAVVAFALAGVRSISPRKWERFAPALAGGTILLCGAAVQFLGL